MTREEIQRVKLDCENQHAAMGACQAPINNLDARDMAAMLLAIHEAVDLAVVTKEGILTANEELLFKCVKRILGR